MTDSLLLTPEERDRFATWLERDATSDRMLCEQIERLPDAVSRQLARERLEDALAKERIARQLRATESI